MLVTQQAAMACAQKSLSPSNVKLADACFGRAQTIIQQRERIKRQTMEYRRLQHRKIVA
jgi:putative transposase